MPGIFLPVRIARRAGSSSIRQTSDEFDDRPTQFRRRRRSLMSRVELWHFIEVSLGESAAQFLSIRTQGRKAVRETLQEDKMLAVQR